MTVSQERFVPAFPAETLDAFVLAPAAHVPDRPAVVEVGPGGGLVSLSYAELAGRTGEYAKQLAALGVRPGDRVMIESHTSAAAIALLLACSRLGAAFIPVDPGTPARRIAAIAHDTGPVLYLYPAGDRTALRGPDGERAVPTVAAAAFGEEGIALDEDRESAAAAARLPGRPAGRRTVVGTDTAYLIFTSGSTGRPKGVVMSHRSALAFYRGTQRFGAVAPGDRVATTSPLAFDVALFDLAVTLGSGACLLVVPRAYLSFPRRLLGFLWDARADLVHGVPSLWRPLLRHERELLASLAGQLRGILVAGESFPLDELRRLRSLLPGLRVVNAFGATETVACSFADVPDPLPDDATGLPLGNGYPGAEIVLLDEEGVPVTGTESAGEMYIRCPSLFTGYWDDPAETARVLVPDPLDPRSGQLVYRSGDLARRGPDGQLYFCGRTDSMVKIRGNRIELGEIERRLTEHPAVTGAVALAVPQAGGELALVAFAEAPGEGGAAAPGAVTAGALAALCRETMPPYMVPKRLHVVDELPVTVNGKADRALLARRAAEDGGPGVP